MTTEQFAYWLQGFVAAGMHPDASQWKTITENLRDALRGEVQYIYDPDPDIELALKNTYGLKRPGA